jgi:hypothetical protein
LTNAPLQLEGVALEGLVFGDLVKEPMDSYDSEAISDGLDEPHGLLPDAGAVMMAGGSSMGGPSTVGNKRVWEPSPPAVEKMGSTGGHQTKKRTKYRALRKCARQEEAAARAHSHGHYCPGRFISSRYGTPNFKILPLHVDTFPMAQTVFVGKHLKRSSADTGRVFTLAELKERGITIISWDGRCVA